MSMPQWDLLRLIHRELYYRMLLYITIFDLCMHPGVFEMDGIAWSRETDNVSLKHTIDVGVLPLKMNPLPSPRKKAVSSNFTTYVSDSGISYF